MLSRHDKVKKPSEMSAPLSFNQMHRDQARHADGDTVQVGCRIPSGITLRLYDLDDVLARHEAHMAGRPVTALLRPVADVTLEGARGDARFDMRDNRLLGMTGYTAVPRSFWEAWVAQNKGCDFLENRLVFAATSAERARDQAAELANVMTGFEGLEPDRLPIPSVSAENPVARP